MANRASSEHQTDRGIVRRRAFLETALNVFSERGYAGVNVNEIVQQTGGSLATLYAQFGSKDGLFVAVLEECNARFAAALCPVADPELPLAKGLQRIGEHYLHEALSARSRRFFRMIAAASGEFPDAARECLRVGPNRVAQIVADYIEARAVKERLVFADARETALAFFALVRGPHHYCAVLDDDYVLSDLELHAHVAKAVSILMSGAIQGGPQHG